MDFLLSIDSVICLITGAILGGLAAQLMKGRGFGLIGDIVVGAVGGVIGGLVFDWLDVLHVGDIADPIIAGAVGAIILLAIAGAIRR